MKVISYLKAIASGLVWGLGQLLNKQFLKALLFFGVFALFIGIELGTSKYFYEEEKPHELAYDLVNGNDFGNSWFDRMPSNYFDLLDKRPEHYDQIKSDSFEEYLAEIGIDVIEVAGRQIPTNTENFTEEKAIEFFAKEFQRVSPKTYTNLSNGIVIPADEFKIEDYNFLRTRETIYYKESTNKFYTEVDEKLADGSTYRTYVETNLLTDKVIENPEVLETNEDLLSYIKTNEFYKDENNEIYLKVTATEVVAEEPTNVTKYLKLNYDDSLIYYEGDISNLTRHTILGPIYLNETGIYEYYQPALFHNGQRLQYNTPNIMYTFRFLMVQTFAVPGNSYTVADFQKLMLRITFAINPELETDFVNNYESFFNNRAGLFLKGYWSVFTLGTAKKQNYTSHSALRSAMIGTQGESNYLGSTITPFTGSIPIGGHISTILLLEGLIAVILSLFFFIFMIWSIRDAYKIAEKKRLEKEIISTKEYFKGVWDDGFEYIILSPAIFVLAFISIMPIVFGFILAFTSISGNESMVENFNYVGLRNFISLFDFNSALGASYGKAFWSVLGWTIIWSVFSTATVFFGGFIQALILNSEKVVFRKLWRTILILPWAIPALLSQMVFSVMFSEAGYINQLLMNIGVYDLFKNIGILGKSYSEMTGILRHFWLGHDNIQWFTNSYNITFVRTTLIVVNIWLGFPYFMALMTGIMTAIDKHLYEAADIDGATGFQKITKITAPLVLYSTAPILIMTFSSNFNNFGVIYFITGGGPNAGSPARGFAGSTDILISWMYNLTVEHSIYNMASVFSVLIFIFVGSITAWNLSKTRAFQGD